MSDRSCWRHRCRTGLLRRGEQTAGLAPSCLAAHEEVAEHPHEEGHKHPDQIQPLRTFGHQRRGLQFGQLLLLDKLADGFRQVDHGRVGLVGFHGRHEVLLFQSAALCIREVCFQFASCMQAEELVAVGHDHDKSAVVASDAIFVEDGLSEVLNIGILHVVDDDDGRLHIEQSVHLSKCAVHPLHRGVAHHTVGIRHVGHAVFQMGHRYLLRHPGLRGVGGFEQRSSLLCFVRPTAESKEQRGQEQRGHEGIVSPPLQQLLCLLFRLGIFLLGRKTAQGDVGPHAQHSIEHHLCHVAIARRGAYDVGCHEDGDDDDCFQFSAHTPITPELLNS